MCVLLSRDAKSEVGEVRIQCTCPNSNASTNDDVALALSKHICRRRRQELIAFLSHRGYEHAAARLFAAKSVISDIARTPPPRSRCKFAILIECDVTVYIIVNDLNVVALADGNVATFRGNSDAKTYAST